MPIPSVSSSSFTTAAVYSATTQPQHKCKCTTHETTMTTHTTDEQILKKDNKKKNTIDTIPKVLQDDENEKETKRKVRLLHARREDDDQMVNLNDKRLLPVSMSGLYAGSKFTGTQKCGTASYEVNVELLHVDMDESTMSGYLKIKGLTSEFPELITFFQAEMMGKKYSFQTRKWQADQKSDLQHWKKFPSFKPYIDIFNNDGFMYDCKWESDYIYMRWKETFLVPDHHVNAIHGASYAGFYYICYKRSTNQIKGFYFFRNHKDWFQELTLSHVSDRGFGSYEFR